MSSVNPHYEYAQAAFVGVNAKAAPEFNEALRADALVQATLAVAWETGRLADETRTANQIALWTNPETSLMDLLTCTQITSGIGKEVATKLLNSILDSLLSEGAEA